MESAIDKQLPDSYRQQVFHALVSTQDNRVGVARSRQIVAERFGLTVEQVRDIEEEGLKQEWPPL